MTRAPKLAVYRLCRTLGLFAVARFVTRRGLRILCYHGFSFADESEFRPGLFIRAGTFESRLRHLEAHGYPILTLEHASRLLARGGLPPNAVVITIDDGFYGVLKLAAPMLKRHEFPATLYVTSYYALKGTPVFRLAVQYIFWKTTAATLDTAGLGLPLPSAAVSVPGPECERRMWEIIHFGETMLGEAERVALTEKLATRLAVDYAAISSSRCFSLMTPEELRGLEASGIDIQLHTHRHHLPDQEQQVSREIADNRAFMEPLAASGLTHFCYPSGVWSRRQWPWLAALGIATATTCDPGFNYASTPLLGLRRFLDGEDVSQIEFEAEVCGFAELLRRGRALLTRTERSGRDSTLPSSPPSRLGAAA